MTIRRLGKIGIVFALCVFILSGCTNPDTRKLQKKLDNANLMLDELKKENERLKNLILDTKQNLEIAQKRITELEKDRNVKIPDPDTFKDIATKMLENVNNIDTSGWQTFGTGIKVGIAGDVLFDLGKYEIKKNATVELDKLAADLHKLVAAGNVVRIEGHTDDVVIRKNGKLWKENVRSNMILAAKRAHAIWKYFTTKHNLPKNKLYVTTFGEYLPVAPNKAKKRGNAANRRVEIVVLPEGVIPQFAKPANDAPDAIKPKLK